MINVKREDSISEAIKKVLHREEAEKMSAEYGKNEPEETPARKTIKAHGGPVEQPKIQIEKPKFVNKALNKEEVEQIDELKKSTLGS